MDSSIRVCIRRGRNLPKTPGAREAFRTDCLQIASSIGTPIWLKEVKPTSSTTITTNDDSWTNFKDSTEPKFHYTPPLAFVTFTGDLTRVHQILSDSESSVNFGEVGGSRKWKVGAMEASKTQKTVPNAFKHVVTGHRSLWKEGEQPPPPPPSLPLLPLPLSSSLPLSKRKQEEEEEEEQQPSVKLVAVNLTKPTNLGSIFRNMSCFGIDEVVHVYKTGVAPPLWDDEHRQQQIKTLSRGTNKHVTRTLISMSEYVDMLKRTKESCMNNAATMSSSSSSSSSSFSSSSSTSFSTSFSTDTRQVTTAPPATKRAKMDTISRPPIVAVETATGASNITSFRFPQSCTIMVGSEGSGISPKILKSLVPGYDTFVVIPMHGKHHSLNVSMAAGIALYEYRRQWPTK